VTGEFQSMAIAMRQKKQAADDQLAAAASAVEATRQQALREKENALRSLILPILECAKQEFESESIPSEIYQRFEVDNPYVSFRCKGPKSLHVPSNTTRLPTSKMLFFYVGAGGRLEAKISTGYVNVRLEDAEPLGDRPVDADDFAEWTKTLLERILATYFDNPDGTLL
jgi:hypothetical protein